MNGLMNVNNEIKMNHVEVTELINRFRELEGNRKTLRPDSLLDKIRKEVKTMKELKLKNSLRNILESTYVNSRGKEYPTFIMNRDGILQMCASESVFVRAKIIEYINALENKLKELSTQRNEREELQLKLFSNDPLEVVEAHKQLIQLEVREATKPLLNKIEEDKPKVSIFDRFLNSKGLYSSTQVAKIFKISSAQKLNKLLNEYHLIYKQGKSWLPYADVNKNWFKIIAGEKEGYNYSQLRFTPEGIIEISHLLNIEINDNDIENYMEDVTANDIFKKM